MGPKLSPSCTRTAKSSMDLPKNYADFGKIDPVNGIYSNIVFSTP